jgi:hypothetical protein
VFAVRRARNCQREVSTSSAGFAEATSLPARVTNAFVARSIAARPLR